MSEWVGKDKIRWRGKVYDVGNKYQDALVELYGHGKFVRVVKTPKRKSGPIKEKREVKCERFYRCEDCYREFRIVQYTDMCVLHYCPLCGVRRLC